MLSWSLWKRRFGGNPAILNQTVYIDAKPYTVIGVMPAWFEFPVPDTPLSTMVNHDKPESVMSALDNHSFRLVGRLRPGIPAVEATTELSMISKRLRDAHLDDPYIFPAASSQPLLEDMVGNIKRPRYVLLAATVCLLLIACLNVANLLVARTAARRKELAIRTALGGGRLRLLREHLVESFLLSLVGGAAGLGLACGAVAWLLRTRQEMPRVDDIYIDGVVTAFTIGIIVMSALFAGLCARRERQACPRLSPRSLAVAQRWQRAGAAAQVLAGSRSRFDCCVVGLSRLVAEEL
ncbi:MAG TPA: FtsX-like permease family protein [Terracidiphilus sp.]|jgi:hypothetical protein